MFYFFAEVQSNGGEGACDFTFVSCDINRMGQYHVNDDDLNKVML
jgi:hypothetical protein